jgi:hypothetical protein
VAIYADNRRNVVVKNGQIQNFGVGVLLGSSGFVARSNVVEHMNIRGATVLGIMVQGDGSVIRHNIIADIGGYQSNSRRDTYGILVSGDFVRVVDNDVSNIYTATTFSGNQNATALYASGKHSVIDSNRITRPPTALGAATLAVGIDLGPSTFCVLRNNSILLAPSAPFLTAIGINSDAPGDSGCLLRDNIVESPSISYSNLGSEGAGAPADSNFPMLPP